MTFSFGVALRGSLKRVFQAGKPARQKISGPIGQAKKFGLIRVSFFMFSDIHALLTIRIIFPGWRILSVVYGIAERKSLSIADKRIINELDRVVVAVLSSARYRSEARDVSSFTARLVAQT